MRNTKQSISLKPTEVILLLLSVICLYGFPHYWDKWKGLLVSIGFAFVLVSSSTAASTKFKQVRYLTYIGISVITYYILFKEQPWQFLFGWLSENVKNAISFSLGIACCSTIMSFAGWLLFQKVHWVRYLFITLLIQIPITIGFNFESVRTIFSTLGKFLRYTDNYNPGDYQTWQFIWMINYYLPVFFWSRDRK